MRTFMMNRPVLKIVPLLFLTFLALASCKDNERDMAEAEMELDSLSRELAEYKKTSDSLQALIEKGDLAKDYKIYYGKEFDSIEDPESLIVSSLKKRPELIPLKPEVGGKMAFRKVKVLTEDWVLGIYDDGHIEGKSIYSYELQPDGKLKFTHITSREPEE